MNDRVVVKPSSWFECRLIRSITSLSWPELQLEDGWFVSCYPKVVLPRVDWVLLVLFINMIFMFTLTLLFSLYMQSMLHDRIRSV